MSSAGETPSHPGSVGPGAFWAALVSWVPLGKAARPGVIKVKWPIREAALRRPGCAQCAGACQDDGGRRRGCQRRAQERLQACPWNLWWR